MSDENKPAAGSSNASQKHPTKKWLIISFVILAGGAIWAFYAQSQKKNQKTETSQIIVEDQDGGLGYIPVSPKITLPNVDLLAQNPEVKKPSYQLSKLDRFFHSVFGSQKTLENYYTGLPVLPPRAEQLADEKEVAGNIKGANEHIEMFWKRYPDIHQLCVEKKLKIQVTKDFVPTNGFSQWDEYYRALRKELFYSAKESNVLKKNEQDKELILHFKDCSELFLIVDNRQTKNSCKVSIKKIMVTDAEEQTVKLLAIEKIHGNVTGNIKKQDFTMQQNSVVKLKLPPGKLTVKIKYAVDKVAGDCDIALTNKVSSYHRIDLGNNYLFQLKPHEDKLYQSKAFAEKTVESAIVFDYFLYKMRFSRKQKERILSQWVGNVLKFNAEPVVQLMSKNYDIIHSAINYHFYFPYIVSGRLAG